MNARVRRYQPMFLSPQHSLPLTPTPKSSWKSKINHQVTLCYNRIHTQSKSNLSPQKQIKSLQQGHSVKQGLRSISTQSNTQTPLKRRQLDLFINPTVSTTIFKTPRQRELQSYYSQRLQLLQQQCNYLRRQFIGHCLRHHRAQFQG